ncbi:MAG: hypothetical protein A2046_01305 [Bacteroidetes bacterium GWA2_30_7]|nr:MAG: hypothetical protein A2046_01305 [Bacteroidetes bacterium GWA2_30_7]
MTVFETLELPESDSRPHLQKLYQIIDECWFRLLWREFLAPSKSPEYFKKKIDKSWNVYTRKIIDIHLCYDNENIQREIEGAFICYGFSEPFIEELILNPEFLSLLKEAPSFNDFLLGIQEVYYEHKRIGSSYNEIIDSLLRHWFYCKDRVVSISKGLVSSLHDIDQEFMLWLKNNTHKLDQISWDAFEKITAEVFASKGYKVELTGRNQNKSADVIAIRNDEFGIETKYLIECKRYSSKKRIGMEIVNGVIGAAVRAKVDHAFLVTTSSFTSNVIKRKAELSELNLQIKDGHEIKEWLKCYKVRSDGGLWLSKTWDNSSLI